MKSLKILFTSTWVLFFSLTTRAQELKNTTTISSLAQPESAVFSATEKFTLFPTLLVNRQKKMVWALSHRLMKTDN